MLMRGVERALRAAERGRAATPVNGHGCAGDNDNDEPNVDVDPELVRELIASGAADNIADDELDARRRRHRETMTRYRHRKKATFAGMKREERALTTKLKRMLRTKAVERSLEAYAARVGASKGDGDSAALVAEFVHVLVEKEQLISENRALREQAEEVHHFHNVLHIELKQEQELKQAAALAREQPVPPTNRSPTSRGPGYWVTFLEDEPPFYFVPFTETECRGISRETNESVLRLQTHDFQSSKPGTTVRMVHFFQWRAHLVFEWDDALQRTMLRFKFCKAFRHPMRSVSELVERMWQVLHTPALYQNLYCVPVNSRVLQTWEDNVSVALWNTPDPDQSLKYRTASIYAHGPFVNADGDPSSLVTITGVQLKTQRGSAASADSAHQSADAVTSEEKAAAGEDEVVFTSAGVIYTMFTTKRGDGESEDGAVDVEFGGRVEVVNEIQARFLMVELGGSLVRLEHLLLPFRVLSTD